jgi:antitoxin component YwqK of YwqJK toxin-antitoxin module
MRVVGNYSIRTVDGKDALAARVTKVYWDAESPPKTFYSIDGAVADDQRKFLIPTAIKSGATLIDRFLPRFTVEVEPQPVDADKPDGDYDVKVSLTHVPTPEWQGELTVKNGAYLVVNDEKTEVTLSGNDFNEYTLRMKLKPGDKVYAEYNLGGYIVRSDTVTVTDKPYVRTLKTWTTYDSGGRKTSEYTYYNDTSGKRVYHGTYRVFSSDGTITESTYVENVLNGPEKQYNKNGLLWAEGQNTNGKRTGTWKDYHFTGELAMVKQYNANGELDGQSYGYFQDGKVSDEITYSNDKIVQIVRYERDGHVYEVQSYSNGVLVKRTYYNPDGSVSSVTNY